MKEAAGTVIVNQMLGSTNKSSCRSSNSGVCKGETCYASCDVAGKCIGLVSADCK